jgi:hypothetical protein
MKKGQKCDVKPGPFSALWRSQLHTAVLVYVNGFGNFRVSQKKFLPLKHPYRAVIGWFLPNFRVSTNFFSIHYRTSERVIGRVLRNFRVPAKFFFKPNHGHLNGLSDGVRETLGSQRKKFENFSTTRV